MWSCVHTQSPHTTNAVAPLLCVPTAAPYRTDARYQRFVATTDKLLASFDQVAEWPDYIAFLGRLAKLLQAHPQFPVVPGTVTVARCLAQCLLPGLPAGVHLKALEVYALIFERISVRFACRGVPRGRKY